MSSRDAELTQLRVYLEHFINAYPNDWKAQLGKVFQTSSNPQLSEFGSALYLQDIQTFTRGSQETFESSLYELQGGPEGFAKRFVDRNLPQPSYRQ